MESERDEDLNDGKLPQLRAGHVAIFDLGSDGRPANCDAARLVQVIGLAAVAPDDPEPEFVDVNSANVAAVTLQENNEVVLIDLASGRVTGHFSAGAVDLEKIDQPGAAAVMKNVTVISLAGVGPKPYGQVLPVVTKSVVVDLLPAMLATKGWISDKTRGAGACSPTASWSPSPTMTASIDATGETLFLRLGNVGALN